MIYGSCGRGRHDKNQLLWDYMVLLICVTDRGWNTTQIRDYGFVTAAYVPVSDLFFKEKCSNIWYLS